MIALYILAGLLLVIALILLLPVSVFIDYKDVFSLKVKFFGFKVFKADNQSDKPQQKTENESVPKEKKENKVKSSFEILKDKKGFSGAVKEVFKFIADCLKHVGKFLKTVKFRKVEFNLTVATEDAAKTAIEYGALCTAVYPTLSFFNSISNVKYKRINVNSDFTTDKGSFDFSLIIKLQILFLIILAYKVFKEYKNFSIRNGLQ